MKNGLPSVSPCSACDERRLGGRRAERARPARRPPARRRPLELRRAASIPSRRRSPISSCSGWPGSSSRLAVGAEEQRAPRLRRAHEVAQQLQRRAVGPVQVVEHEHAAARRAPISPSSAATASKKRKRCASGLAVGGAVVGGRRPELRQQDRELGGARAEPLAQRVQRRAGRPAAQHLDHRLVGVERLLVEAPVEHDARRRRARARPSSAASRVLPMPGVAGQQDERALAADRLVPAAPRAARARAAPDERVAVERGGQRRRPAATAGTASTAAARARAGGALAAQQRARGRPSRPARASCRARRAAAGAAPRTRAAPRPGCRPPRGPPSAAGARTRGTAPRRSRRARPARRRRARARPGAGRPRPAPRARAARRSSSSRRCSAHPGAVAVGQEGLQVDGERVARRAAAPRPVAGLDRRLGLRGGRRRGLDVDATAPGGTQPQLAAAGQHAVAERAAQLRQQRAERASRPRPAAPRATARRSARRAGSRGRG